MTTLNRYDKISKNILGLLLLLFTGSIAILNLLVPDRTFSESENRMLEPLPQISLKSLTSGKFTSDFEKYISDQLIFRDLWIGVKTDTDRIMGKKESNGIYLGKDGHLIQQFIPPEDGDLEKKVDAILAFDRATPNLRKYVMLVPTATTLLKEQLPAYAPAGDEKAYLDQIRQLIQQRGIPFVNVYPALYTQREQPIFYKTDHHWTTRGAYFAYRELCKQMGIPPQQEEDFNIRQVSRQFYGSLHSKSGFRQIQPDSIELYLPKDPEKYTVEYVDEDQTSDSLYEMEQLHKKDQYAVFLNGNHPLIRITTAHPEKKRLLVVKDSYANSLIPFLTKHFSEIDVVDLRYYEGDLTTFVKEREIDELLLLYNVHTFSEDPSIKNLSEAIQ
ncbi:DHHW protein [Kroppenstedtia eburnea]|uniref:DHHW protein n=1 Tax=Kroppenstedtia eburnea TaxID=714067 RepID=A0A1N7NSS0_9BACL|nr:DHHW protein [Kroppenstedtia eburnea]